MNAMRPRAVVGIGLFTFLLAGSLQPAPGQTQTSHERTTDQKIAFYRARIGGPTTYPAYARLGIAYLEKGRQTGKTKDYKEGLRCLRQSLTYQRNFEALLGLAIGLSERHFFKEALPYAEEALAAMPSDLEAAGALFDIRLALGKVSDAEKGLNTMLNAQMGFHALSRVAALREYRGDLFGALETMKQARLDAATNFAKSMVSWADVRIGSLEVGSCAAEKAAQSYENALTLVPGYFFANEHLAELHAAQGRWKEAEKSFRQLLKTRPEPQYRVGLAEALIRQGKSRESRHEREKAITELRRSASNGAQDPFRPLALMLLEDKESAAEGLRWAARDWDVRQDALAADTLGWAYHCNCNGPEAFRLSEEALRSGSKNPSLLLHGGLIRCSWGRQPEGRELIAKALECPLALGPHERTLAESARQALAKNPP